MHWTDTRSTDLFLVNRDNLRSHVAKHSVQKYADSQSINSNLPMHQEASEITIHWYGNETNITVNATILPGNVRSPCECRAF